MEIFKKFYLFFLSQFKKKRMAIRSVASLAEIQWDQFGKDDLVAFDLDDTCFVPKDPLMRNANAQARKDFLDKLKLEQGEQAVARVFDTMEHILVEPCLVNYLAGCESQTFGFTVRRTGLPTLECKHTVEDLTTKILADVGIEFKSSFANLVFPGMKPSGALFTNFVVDKTLKSFEIEGDAMVKNGVLFTNNLEKGLVLSTLFSVAKIFPQTLVFIDDKEANLVSVQSALKAINAEYGTSIDFRGFHYTAAASLDNSISC